METSDDEEGSPLRRKIREVNKTNDDDATKRSININEIADVEQYLSDKGIETVDERIEYLKEIDSNDINPDLEKLGIRSGVDRDQMIRAEESLKAIGPIIAANAPAITAAQEIGRVISDPAFQANSRIAAELSAIMENSAAIQAVADIGKVIENNPAFQANSRIAAEMERYNTEVAKFSSTIRDIASIRSRIPGAEYWNIPAAMNQMKNSSASSNKPLLKDAKDANLRRSLVPPPLEFTLPDLSQRVADLPNMGEGQWKRHNELLGAQNQLLDSQKDIYEILAADAKTNQDALNEQKRTTRLTWAVLGVGVISTFSIASTAISQNRSLISDPIAIGLLLMLGLIWVIVLAFVRKER